LGKPRNSSVEAAGLWDESKPDMLDLSSLWQCWWSFRSYSFSA